MKIAVLIASYNRKNKTLACLQSLQQQLLPAGIELQVHLTDDNSTDGTREAVMQQFPATIIYNGTGNLFWAGGMRHTWQHAMQTKPAFFLLLNDDTVLQPNAVKLLVEASTQNATAICIGSTCDAQGNLSYGGWKLGSKVFWKSRQLQPAQQSVQCDFANANIMLVPQKVVERIGILSENFTHSLADFDYTLKAKKSGFDIVMAPGFLGHCTNDHSKNWQPQAAPLRQRIAYLKSPKGLAYKEYLHFIQQHFPFSYPSAFCKLWLKTFFPFVWDALKKP